MNRENPRSPPNPRSDFCGTADEHQRFSKRVSTLGFRYKITASGLSEKRKGTKL
jgi:hypothetical protein